MSTSDTSHYHEAQDHLHDFWNIAVGDRGVADVRLKSMFMRMAKNGQILQDMADLDDNQKSVGSAAFEARGLRAGMTRAERKKHDEIILRNAFLENAFAERLGKWTCMYMKVKAAYSLPRSPIGIW